MPKHTPSERAKGKGSGKHASLYREGGSNSGNVKVAPPKSFAGSGKAKHNSSHLVSNRKR